MKFTALLLAAATLGLGPAAIQPCAAAVAAGLPGFACCKRCSAGKACGDSCISRDKTCHKGQGCACDA